MPDQFDVIVVGAGGSGLAAGISAAQNGGRVLVLERQPQPGGTTGIAVGSLTAAGTSLQRDASIDDDAASHAEDASKFAPPQTEARNNDAMRRYFLSEAATTFQWVRDMGLSFVGPSPEPPNRVPRMHNVVAGAKAYIATMQMELSRLGGTLVCRAGVNRLLQRNGRVAGVEATVDGNPTELLATRGVILAAGDYANHSDTIAQHKGSQFSGIEGINPFALGDGHRLAQSVGAELRNMDVTYGPELRFVPSSRRPFQQWLPTQGVSARIVGAVARRLPGWAMRHFVKRLLVTWQHPETAMFDDGAILLNRDGARFVDETHWPEREIAVADQPDKVAFMLLDERMIRRYSAWPHFISTAPDIAYAYTQDYRRLRPDVTADGADLSRLLVARGLDPERTEQAIASFNRCAVEQRSDEFGRVVNCDPLAGGRWMLLGPLKAYFTTTEGGAMVDRNLHVLDQNEAVIPGLYAVGQNGLSGMILWGHGLHISWALTSGRLAGEAIMRNGD
ncbi:MAG: FAD-dependent oxidoreductase [Pirellulaceae bacterium]|jgi:fumarate reductase flavoprotein subunit|nr:FAD-dependent oxidoreductase [Pirellulaceae bacterium]HJN10428.1 FAD-dependent oxidoreductase [Pirellulaceae bacterium]